MEQNNPKFRLRLNLFDAIIVVLVLLVGGALILLSMRTSSGQEPAAASGTVRYTILVQRMAQGDSALIEPGDPLQDTVENYRLGNVVSVRAQPTLVQVLDEEGRRYVEAELAGYEDVYITVESACTQGEDSLLLDGGYEFRVGQAITLRGPGYLGSGRVSEIVRGDGA